MKKTMNTTARVPGNPFDDEPDFREPVFDEPIFDDDEPVPGVIGVIHHDPGASAAGPRPTWTRYVPGEDGVLVAEEYQPTPEEERKEYVTQLARQLHKASLAAAIQHLVYGIERKEIERCAIAAWQVKGETIDGQPGDKLFLHLTADAFGVWDTAKAFAEAGEACRLAWLFAGAHRDKMPAPARLSFAAEGVKQ